MASNKRKDAPFDTTAEEEPAKTPDASRPPKRCALPWSGPRKPWSRESGLLEAQRQIRALLSREHLKEVRLVSRGWATAAEPSLPLLFETVFLHLDLESFDKLRQISFDDRLRKLVKAIVYNGSTLKLRENYEDWLKSKGDFRGKSRVRSHDQNSGATRD
jgi:hypothetical protein